MTGISSLIRIRDDDEIQIVRLYTDGHVPLASFEEEVRDEFANICSHFKDDSERCHLKGEAFWAYLRLAVDPPYRAKIGTDAFPGSDPVTMIKVYRKRRVRSR